MVIRGTVLSEFGWDCWSWLCFQLLLQQTAPFVHAGDLERTCCTLVVTQVVARLSWHASKSLQGFWVTVWMLCLVKALLKGINSLDVSVRVQYCQITIWNGGSFLSLGKLNCWNSWSFFFEDTLNFYIYFHFLFNSRVFLKYAVHMPHIQKCGRGKNLSENNAASLHVKKNVPYVISMFQSLWTFCG